MARKKIIAGNWKMNMTPSQAVELIETLKPLVKNDDVDVVFCVPAIDIIPAMEAAKGSNINIGAENMYFEEKGAFTGEISPAMLVDAGVKYVIIGHSERREYFAETDETVNKKVLKAFEHNITPIICCGETLTQREQARPRPPSRHRRSARRFVSALQRFMTKLPRKLSAFSTAVPYPHPVHLNCLHRQILTAAW